MSKFQGGVGEPLPWVFDLGEPGCALPTSILKMKTWFNEEVNLTRVQYKKVIKRNVTIFFRSQALPGNETNGDRTWERRKILLFCISSI
ncbi:MAG: hypothetical protein B1H11_10950 [Desulfobacteraceae bacterium 4484_190.1]|nr:MAG: hypothetical protein B1H11_10950 [Desulfobacteraceae bacterium 4484_190.1]